MDAARWKTVREIFDDALAYPPPDRIAFIVSRCGEDEGLRRDVEALLASHERAGGFLDTPAVDDVLRVVGANDGGLAPGDRVGQYTVVREIGRGGMGVVHLAKRDGEFEQQVALKVIKRGLDTEEILRRFLNERQILASLNHPNIARLFDGGSTDRGLPYFVMEYVDGLPLLQYCEQQRLDLTARLQLFQHVCAAVQHAHQNLVVHRDLKPSNIIVTADGLVKLLDFGIARLIDAETGDVRATATHASRVLTPEYASPEQIRGGHVTTASDVYSLGVILYEMLTGVRPFAFKDTTPQEMMRVATDEVPTKPSAATHDGAGYSGRALAGDLDNIVLMALRKEPERRYGSVEQLSEDIRRHLAGLPVAARKDTLPYRASKFVGRHRVAVAAAVVVMVSLIGGMVTTAWQAREARQQQRAAELEQVKARAISRFVQGMLSSPIVSQQGQGVRVLDVLDESVSRAATELAGQPEVLLEVYVTIGSSYMQIARWEAAEKCFRAAIDLAGSVHGARSLQAAAAQNLLANLVYQRGRFTESEELSRRSLEIYTELGHRRTKDAADDMSMIGLLLANKGQRAEAAPFYVEALDIFRELGLEETREASTTRNNLGALYMQAGDLPNATKYYQQAITIYRKSATAYSQISLATTLQNLAAVHKLRGDLDIAEPMLHEAIATRRRLLGEGHPHIAIAQAHLADLFLRRGDLAKAEQTARDAWALQKATLPAGHADRARSLLVLGQTLTASGRLSEAERHLRDAVAIRRAVMTRNNALLPVTEGALGECLLKARRYDEAQPLLIESYQALSAIEGDTGINTRVAIERLVALYTDRDPAKAASYNALLNKPGR